MISATVLLINYAKGYRPDLENRGLKATGLLVASSDPKGAQVYLNGELITATDDTLTLDPGEYMVEIRKAGFIPWKKQLLIEKELVAQTDAVLFPITPNLQSVTSSGALNPSLSPNGTKLLYSVEESEDATTAARLRDTDRVPQSGLWLMGLTNLPLGFNQDPRQLVAGEPPVPVNNNNQVTNNKPYSWSEAQLLWSPDSREVLAFFYPTEIEETTIESDGTLDIVPRAVYLINTGNETVKATELTNISNKYEDIAIEWQDERQELLDAQMAKLPNKFDDLIATSAANLRFAPDETKVLYTATISAQLAEEYIPPVPAASTQLQERSLTAGRTYMYDLKEDRNFLILDEVATEQLNACNNFQFSIFNASINSGQVFQSNFNDHNLTSDQNVNSQMSDVSCPKLNWFPTSRHLVYVAENKVSIMEYDATNNQVVYAGPLESNYVFVHPSPSKLLLVTNLNPDAFPLPNIYSLSLR